MENKIIWWILFCVDFIVYGICCVFIIKRKNFTSISIRSPTLLLFSILSNFFMSIIILLYKLYEKNVISSFYYLFRLMLIFSMIFRYERILVCCKTHRLNKLEEELDRKHFKEKRYLYQEKFYVRLLIGSSLLFLIVMVIIKLNKIKNVEFFYTFNYIYDYKNDFSLFKSQMMGWIIWNFIEQFVMISYIFRIINKPLKEKLKTELFSFFILWYLYSFIPTFINYYTKHNNKDKDEEKDLNSIIIIISLCVHYICLFINGYFPIYLSYHYKTAISYHFSPKLMNNFYLFLTNEECYDAFLDYLIKTNNNKDIFYLKLYTHIMKYKLSFVLNINKDIGLNDANEIFETYFSENSIYQSNIDDGILSKVRNECKVLDSNTFTPELFDEALQFIFKELNKRFLVFHNTKEYKDLYEKIKLDSYIQCKMCNCGLINKY